MASDSSVHATAAPLGVAVGVSVCLVGLVVSLAVAAVGLVIAVVCGVVWARSTSRRRPEHGARASVPPPALEAERYPRSRFLERATLAIGGIAGAVVALPVAGVAILPAFARPRRRQIVVGGVRDFPEGMYVVTTFLSDSAQGAVSRRTAYVRNNGLLHGLPSFTILSSRCTHVGCPTQPNGPVFRARRRSAGTRANAVSLTPASPAGFGCPCHGSQFDTEGNRTAGPAARALDRYEYSIVDGRLVLGAAYSVSRVDGVGAEARIHRFRLDGPGQPVDGPEGWLYALQPPH